MSNLARPSLPRRFGRTAKGFLLWSHERGSWQYDVMVGLILLFVLLIPPRFFHDQPVYNPHLIRDVVQLSSDQYGTRYRVSAELLASYDPNPRQAAGQVLAENLNHPVEITRIEPISGEGSRAIVWYDVWVRDEPGSGP
jgi:hypothetical protein